MRPYHLKVAAMMTDEVRALVKEFGIERVGFLTLTFAENVQSKREAAKRFNSLRTNVLATRYLRALGQWERQKSGRWHVHLVVALREDIRTGADFAAFALGDYRSASRALRAEWAFWRATAPLYRFGRTELLPIKSTVEGVARYVGKYITKHVNHRKPEDCRERVVTFINYQRGAKRRSSTEFAWAKGGALKWRQKLPVLAAQLGVETYEDFGRLFGPRWARILCQVLPLLEVCYEPEKPLCYPRRTHVKQPEAGGGVAPTRSGGGAAVSGPVGGADSGRLVARLCALGILEAKEAERLRKGEDLKGLPVRKLVVRGGSWASHSVPSDDG